MCKLLERNSHEHTTSLFFRMPLCQFNMAIYTTLHDANSSLVLLAMLFFPTGFKHETVASTIFAEVILCIIARRGSMQSTYVRML